MPISNVSLTNTFDQWRLVTNQLAIVANDILNDGRQTYRNLIANVTTSNSVVSNVITISAMNVEPTIIAAFNQANSAFNQANIASVAFNQANIASAAFNQANIASVAFDQANSASVVAVSAYNTVNSISTAFNAANVVSQTLTDGTTISWNATNGQIATVTLGGNRVLANINNARIGTYILHVIQDGVGGRNLTFEQGYRFTGNIAPPLTTTPNGRDVFSFVYDGSKMYGSFIPDVG